MKKPPTTPTLFDYQRARSNVWEVALSNLLRQRGAYVIPTYDFSGADGDKAPRALAPTGRRNLVLPDLDCFIQGEHGGQRFWLEIKRKQHSIPAREGWRVTGFALRLWNDYCAVQTASGAIVYVAFVHIDEREVRVASLRQLSDCYSHESDSPEMGRMIFFQYSGIPRWGVLELGTGQAESTAKVQKHQ